jgi:phosphoribosylglycinamide formyltransferase-1
MPSEDKARIAIFASGTGSNADKICSYFYTHTDISVALIITNRAEAGVRQVAVRHGIESVYIPKKYWPHPEVVLPFLESYEITHIVLAGFLLHVPEWLIQTYQGKIINIHPALLPRYGGKGMYGHHVHEAVKGAGDRVSGITIHEVNEHYDEGRILFQKEVELDEDDSPEMIAQKVLQLEHTYFPQVIEAWIRT